jgi:hypothetical protein
VNPAYIKYGIIAAIGIIILYAMMKGSAPAQQSGVVGVDVNYTPMSDPAAISARASGFSELTGLFGSVISETLANETARTIALSEDETTRYALDASERVEQLRFQNLRDLQEFQAGQVSYIAESYRNKDVARQANVLNAIASLWGGSTNYPYPQSSGGATGILNAIGGIVRGAAGVIRPGG